MDCLIKVKARSHDLFLGKRNIWREAAGKAALCRTRNLPYAKETEDVVNAVCIKELRHILQAASPP